MTPELQRLFAGYFCVFVGDPKRCTPYACLASLESARVMNLELEQYHLFEKYPVMTVEEWAKQFEPPEV